MRKFKSLLALTQGKDCEQCGCKTRKGAAGMGVADPVAAWERGLSHRLLLLSVVLVVVVGPMDGSRSFVCFLSVAALGQIVLDPYLRSIPSAKS